MSRDDELAQLFKVVSEAYKPEGHASGSLANYIYNQGLKSCGHGDDTHPERCFKMAAQLELGIFQLQELVAVLQRVGFTGE